MVSIGLNLTNILYVIYKGYILNDVQSKLWYFYNCVQHVQHEYLCSHGFDMLCFNVTCILLTEFQMQNKHLLLISQVYVMYLR